MPVAYHDNSRNTQPLRAIHLRRMQLAGSDLDTAPETPTAPMASVRVPLRTTYMVTAGMDVEQAVEQAVLAFFRKYVLLPDDIWIPPMMALQLLGSSERAQLYRSYTSVDMSLISEIVCTKDERINYA